MKKAVVYVTIPENCPYHLHHEGWYDYLSYDYCRKVYDDKTGRHKACKNVIPEWCPLENSNDYEAAGLL